MFLQTWNKYVPVIKILLKRSLNAEQTLYMNSSDFQRASGGKKVKFTFSIQLTKGRLMAGQNFPHIAKDLVSVLQQDSTTNKFIQQHELEFAVNSNFELYIKNNTLAEKPVEQTDQEITETNEGDPDVSLIAE
jgi:hypothetical protein